jgi:hypothetical protein
MGGPAEAAAAHLAGELEAARREGATALAARQLGGARGVLIDGHGDRRDGVYRPEGEDHLGFPRFARRWVPPLPPPLQWRRAWRRAEVAPELCFRARR